MKIWGVGMSANDVAPIIIKRKKVSGGDGHHGGAWKVAYADFVTAMMAFFMLMWLLNATTETQRKGIADYFSPTIPINRISGGGDGAFGGDSVFTDDALAHNGSGASLPSPAASENEGAEGETEGGGAEGDVFEEIEKVLSARGGESMVSEQLQRHIVTRLTDDGLIVELHDLPDAALFFSDTTEPTLIMVELVSMLSEVFSIVPNEIAVQGHSAARALVVRDNPIWDLSTARANEVRQMLGREGVKERRVQRVTGFADRKPVVSNLMAARNNRIELILLRDKL